MKPQRTEARSLELRDFLKRRLARESFGLRGEERTFVVKQYAAMIDRAYPCRRIYIGSYTPIYSDGINARVYPLFTPAGSHWRTLAIAREYPNVQF